MIFHKSIILTTILLSLKHVSFVNSFSIASSNTIVSQKKLISNTRYITSLYAEEESNEENVESGSNDDDKEEKSESGSSDNAGNDILNSPAFLKRKLEVLQSDLAAVDEKISSANAVYEENKAEWGPQLDDLRKEVSYNKYYFLYVAYYFCGLIQYLILLSLLYV